MFKCLITFVVFPDLYYDPTNLTDGNFSSTVRCLCHWVAELFPNKWFIRFWRLRQIAEKRFFPRYADWVWSGIAQANITCCGIDHCDWLKPMGHRKSALTSKKTSWEIRDFLPSLSECTLYGRVTCHLKNRNKPRFANWKTVNWAERLKPRIPWTAINRRIPYELYIECWVQTTFISRN